MKNNLSKILWKFIPAITVLVGIGYLLYPIYLSRVVEKERTDRIIEEFESNLIVDLSDMSQKSKSSINIFKSDPIDEIIGVIYIPKIHLSIPLYYGVSDQSLSYGAGIIKEFGKPMARKNTNPVITSHSGLSSSGLFSELEKIEINDEYYIRAEDGKLQKYIVKDISTVLPTQLDSLLPQKDKTTTTLMTCVPYGINSHRLLVRGEFDSYIDVSKMKNEEYYLSSYEKKVIMILSGMLLIFLFVYLTNARKESYEKD